MILMDKTLGMPDVYGDVANTEKAFGVLGMTYRNAAEFTTKNMRAFNEVCVNDDSVKYASFGAKRRELQLCELLKPNYQTITDHQLEIECDGLMRPEEAKWGTYLLTLEHDHLEAAGFNPKVDVRHIANLMTDNCRVCEIDA